ncbi:MAG: hypothetical protein OSA99_09140 [Acidimicrobiales bacterium]|nr:hypothetical protein [Acidimicrobiales bacterium]
MSSTDSTDDPDLRAARRTLGLFAVAVAAVVAGFVLVLTGSRGDDGAVTIAGDADPTDEAAGDDAGDGRIGPTPGQDVERYLADRRAALESVEGRRVAVVSLTGYSSVDTVEDLLDDLELDRYLVALVGGEPIETRSVDEAFADVVADAEMQLAELEQLAPTVEDPEFAEFYSDEIERYQRILDSADGGDVVFGVVVVGTVANLRGLGSRASVRLVDVGDSSRVDQGVLVRGIRPEESATIGEPPFRP